MRKSFLKKFKIEHQLDSSDCGVASLQMIARHYGKYYTIKTLRERCSINREGVSIMGISDAAEQIGFHTIGVRISLAQIINEVPLPCIIHWGQSHFVVLYKIKKSRKGYHFYVADPSGGKLVFNESEFKTGWCSTIKDNIEKGVCLLLEPTPNFYSKNGEPKQSFGFKYLFSYLKPYKKLLRQLALSLLFASFIQLLFPFLAQSVIDIGINENNLNFIYLVLIGQFVLMISQSFVEFIRGWILLHIGTRVNISLISEFLVKLMKLPISFFDSKMIGDIIQRINDHERIEEFLTSYSLQIMFSFFNLVIFGVVLFFYSLKIFLVYLCGSLLYIIWVSVFLKKRRQLDNKNFALMAANQSNIYQLITGMQEIKLNNCEKQKRWEWENLQIKSHKVSIKSLSLSQYQHAGGVLFNESKNILITFLAASSVLSGDLTLGMMLAIQYIIGQLNAPLDQLVGFFKSAQDAKISFDRLAEIHLKKDEEQTNINKRVDFPNQKEAIVSELSFRYSGPNPEFVLKDINLSIPEGKITAIVGQSGSGKTTLLKMLLGFYKPNKGDIYIGGDSLENYKTSFWRKNCGVVMQDGFIFSDSIAKNIAISDEKVNKDKLINAVKIANIKEFIETLPLGYNTRVGTEGIGLSQGQKQRILIARAVYKNPEFLFFDEATNALDTTNEKQIMKNLEQFFKKRTVIIIAHRLSTVKNADQIVVLEKGKIIEKGKHEVLVKKKGAYFNLVKDQLELGK